MIEKSFYYLDRLIDWTFNIIEINDSLKGAG